MTRLIRLSLMFAVILTIAGARVAHAQQPAPLTIQFGLPGDVTVPADYDGDGKIDLAVWRPSTGVWYILTSSSGYAQTITINWGLPGDVPVPGVYGGDGRANVAVFRPSNGTWYVSLATFCASTDTVSCRN